MARRWINYTDLPDAELRRLYRAIRPKGIPAHDVYVADCLTGIGCGIAMVATTGTLRVFVNLPRTERRARTGRLRGQRITSRREAFVYIAAHELFHLWQARQGWAQSEADADRYGIAMLRRYRTGALK